MVSASRAARALHSAINLRQFRHLSTGPLTVGTIYSSTRQFTEADVAHFLNITGDDNPIHTHADAAKAAGFPTPILPGIMMASLFPAIIGSHFPGAVYLTQSLAFKAPAQVGSLIHAEVCVKRCSGDKVSFDTKCFRLEHPPGDYHRVVLVEGTALAWIK